MIHSSGTPNVANSLGRSPESTGNVCGYLALEVEEGEIVTLIGANGAGKTTTLMSLCGIVPPRSGEILFQGKPVHGLSGDKIVQMGIIQVPEGRRIFPNMSVMENLEMGAYLRTNKALVKQDTDGGQLDDPTAFVKRLNGILVELSHD